MSHVQPQSIRDGFAKELMVTRGKKTLPIIQRSGRRLARNLLANDKKYGQYEQLRMEKLIKVLEGGEDAPAKLTKQLNGEMVKYMIRQGETQALEKYRERFTLPTWESCNDILQLLDRSREEDKSLPKPDIHVFNFFRHHVLKLAQEGKLPDEVKKMPIAVGNLSPLYTITDHLGYAKIPLAE